jgi:hypothetical protein
MQETQIRRMLIEQPPDTIRPQAQERKDLAAKFSEMTETYGTNFHETIRWIVKVCPRNTKEVSTDELVAIAEGVKDNFYPDIERFNEWEVHITVSTTLGCYDRAAAELLRFLDRIRDAEVTYRQFKRLSAIQEAERERIEETRIAEETQQERTLKDALEERT